MITLNSLKQTAYNEMYVFVISAILFCLIYSITYQFVPNLSIPLTIVVWCVWALPIYAVLFLAVTSWYVVGSIAILVTSNKNLLMRKSVAFETVPGVFHLLTLKGFYYFITLIIVSWLTIILMSYIGTLHNAIYAYIGSGLSVVCSFIIADFLTRIMIIDGQVVVKENISIINEIVEEYYTKRG